MAQSSHQPIAGPGDPGELRALAMLCAPDAQAAAAARNILGSARRASGRAPAAAYIIRICIGMPIVTKTAGPAFLLAPEGGASRGLVRGRPARLGIVAHGKPTSPAPRNLQASGTLQAVAGGSASVSPSAPADGMEPALASPAASPPLTSAASWQSAPDQGLEGSCPPSAVVLSLFSMRPSYSIGQDPRFVIWDSADRARTHSTQVERLSSGVPMQESFKWNRTITLPGCIEVASAAPPGTYEVQARTATGASQVRTFNLR